jgi:PAS domain S-box-containing protein
MPKHFADVGNVDPANVKSLVMGTVISPWVIIFIAAILVQGFLILAILITRQRKRTAETECKRLSALAETEAKRLDTVVSTVPGVIWETRTDPLTQHQKTVFVSQPAEPMLGYSRDEWLSTPNFCIQLVHHDDRDRVKRECEEILLTGKQGVLNFRWLAKDHRTVWVRSQLAPVLDHNGKTIGCQGVTLDVTEQKLAEEAWRQSEQKNQGMLEALTRSEAQLAGMIDSAMDAIIITDDSQNVVLFNTAAEKLFACSSQEALGHSIHRFIPERFRHVHEEHVRKVDEDGGTPRLMGSLEELYGVKSTGEEFPIEASISQIKIRDEKFYTLILRDITTARKSVDQLRESEERFRSMADTAPVMIWISGPLNQCTYVNKQWLDFTGRTSEEELGAGWMHSVHPEDFDACAESLRSNFELKRTFESEFRLRRHDGEYRWLYNCGSPRFSTAGAFLGYIGSSIDISERKASEVALRIANEELYQLKNQLEAENIYLQQELQRDEKFGGIVGHSDAIKYVLFKITQVSPTDSTVLITGETGTGKDLVARAIHATSSRKDRPLIKVNCAALSPTLIESELFGHEKGAFTGAIGRKQGRFELANGGTIFLDEIGELPLELQVKLLRVIQESEFERLGGNRTIKVDVRIIAATNRNLKLEVEQGTFREDLWYRLNVYPITMPPLRQRKDDIPLLVEHFVATYGGKSGKTISSVSPREMQNLQEHSWPGNIRELANVIERAVIHTQGSVLHVVDQFESVEGESTPTQTLEEVEREYILRTLESTGWRVEGKNGAAKVLGLNPSTLRTRMLKLGIQRRRAIYG